MNNQHPASSDFHDCWNIPFNIAPSIQKEKYLNQTFRLQVLLVGGIILMSESIPLIEPSNMLEI